MLTRQSTILFRLVFFTPFEKWNDERRFRPSSNEEVDGSLVVTQWNRTPTIIMSFSEINE